MPPVLSLVLNILWMVFGGLLMAIGWLFATTIMVITIIGIPWARAALTMAWYTLLPFGRTAIRRNGGSIGAGPLGTVGNILWLLFAGWWLALGHLFSAFFWAVTFIGLPFAWAHLKLAGFALWPIGADVISVYEADTHQRLYSSR